MYPVIIAGCLNPIIEGIFVTVIHNRNLPTQPAVVERLSDLAKALLA